MNQYALTLEQGTTLILDVVWHDPSGVVVDITGYEAKMHVVDSLSNREPLVEFSSTGGGSTGTSLTVGTTNGTVTVGLTATASAALPFTEGVFEILVKSPGGVITALLKGTFTVNAGIGW